MRIAFGESWPVPQYSEAREMCGVLKEGFQVRMKGKKEDVPSLLEQESRVEKTVTFPKLKEGEREGELI